MNWNSSQNPVPISIRTFILTCTKNFLLVDSVYRSLSKFLCRAGTGTDTEFLCSKIKKIEETSQYSGSYFYIKTFGRPPSVPYMLGFCLRILFQILFQTLFLYMILWMTLFHDRWKNVRDFITRTYAKESVIFLSGFALLTAFMITTFGRDFSSVLYSHCAKSENWMSYVVIKL